MANFLNLDDHIRGLIFDCDGTLVDSMPLHMQAWCNAFNKLNLYYHEEYLFSLKGMKETEIIGLYNEKFDLDIDPEKIVWTKHDYFRSHVNEVKPVEPVVEIARKYRDIKPLSVVSGSVREIVHSELKVLGIFDWFDYIFTADDPFKPKPAPDLFLAAASKMNVDPKRCVVFEDGDAGLEAAERAGMKSIDVRDPDTLLNAG